MSNHPLCTPDQSGAYKEFRRCSSGGHLDVMNGEDDILRP